MGLEVMASEDATTEDVAKGTPSEAILKQDTSSGEIPEDENPEPPPPPPTKPTLFRQIGDRVLPGSDLALHSAMHPRVAANENVTAKGVAGGAVSDAVLHKDSGSVEIPGDDFPEPPPPPPTRPMLISQQTCDVPDDGFFASQSETFLRVSQTSSLRQEGSWPWTTSSLMRRASVGTLQHPIITALPQLAEPFEKRCVKLLCAESFQDLPTLLPRSQDISRTCFGVPGPMDIVVAVSHAWPHRFHPDGLGVKRRIIAEFLSQLCANLTDGKVFVFFDFLSLPQRPFRSGQLDRNREEQAQFDEALSLMHRVYFHADRVLHLDLRQDSFEFPGQAGLVTVSSKGLKSARVEKQADWLVVMDERRDSMTSYTSTYERRSTHSEGSIARVSLAVASLGLGSDRGFMGGFGIGSNPLSRVTNSSRTSAPSQIRAKMFDRLLAIEGVAVETEEAVKELIEAGDHDSKATLQRFPFGRPNRVPAGERGWVYLERFVTMVKCAMLEEGQGEQVVVASSEETRFSLLEGACRLRRAAAACDSGPESSPVGRNHSERGFTLREELQAFLAELGQKSFTGTSPDAGRQAELLAVGSLETAPAGDAEVVARLMAEFAELLQDRWDELGARQRSRERRLQGLRLAVSESLRGLFAWQGLSEPYAAELLRADRSFCLAIPILAVPVLCCCGVLLAPYASPDGGWREQALYYACGFPATSLLCAYGLAYFHVELSGLRRTGFHELRALLWDVLVAALALGARILVEATGPFPCPAALVLVLLVGTLLLPVLWFTVPARARTDQTLAKRLLRCTVGLLAMMIVHALLFLVQHAIMVEAGAIHEAVLVLMFLLGKIVFEKFGCLARLGSDSMPCFTYLGGLGYHLHLCIALSCGLRPAVYLVLVLAGVLPNSFRLASLCCHRPAAAARRGDRQEWLVQQSMLANMMMGEFAETIVPCQYLLILVLMYVVQPRHNGLVCQLTADEFTKIVMFLGFGIIVEFLCIGLTVTTLELRGFAPVNLLRRLICTHVRCLTFLTTSILLFVLSVWHSHGGVDMSARFLWLKSTSPVWECGPVWALKEASNF